MSAIRDKGPKLRERIFLITVLSLVSCFVCPSHAITYYIDASNGNDTNNGSIESPFASLEKARDTIRDLKVENKTTSPITVYLRNGTYLLDSAFLLNQTDSGSKDAPITYRAYPKERVIISGGVRLNVSWQASGQNPKIYWSNLTDFIMEFGYFNSLFIDSERAQRARIPDADHSPPYFHLNSTDPQNYDHAFNFSNGDINASWRNMGDIEIISYRRWEQARSRILNISGQTLLTTGSISHNFGYSYDGHDRYFIENVFEGLDSPGEWYLDREKKILYYWPKDEERIEEKEFIVPVLHQLLIVGDRQEAERFISKDYIEIDGKNFDYGLKSFSISVWLRFPNGSINPRWSLSKGDAWNEKGYAISHFSEDDPLKVGFYINDGNRRFSVVTSGSYNLNRSQWGHFVFVVNRSAGTLKLYKDGALAATSYISLLGNISNSHNLFIGKMGVHRYTGWMDELKIFGRALGKDEIKMLRDNNSLQDTDLWIPFNGTFPKGTTIHGALHYSNGAFGKCQYFSMPETNDSFEGYVEFINFLGIEFEYTDWSLPDTGYPGGQGLSRLTSPPAIGWIALSSKFINNTVRHTGSHAIEGFSKDSEIARNEFYDIGASGIKLGTRSEDNLSFQRVNSISSSNSLHDNRIHDFGRVYAEGSGIYFGLNGENNISHNQIYKGGYTGITTGWFSQDDPEVSATNNIIEYNLIHDVMQELNDGAGIYVKGRQPGAKIRGNRVYNILRTAKHDDPRKIWGIYLDGSSENFRIRQNWIYRTQTGGLMLNHKSNGNKNNLAENNIFVDGIKYQADLYTASYDNFTKNIIYYKINQSSEIFTVISSSAINYSDKNIFYSPNNTKLSLKLDEWQDYGHDAESLISDPLFANYSGDNFTLLPGSPAFALGFKSFDLSNIGPSAQCFEEDECASQDSSCIQRQCIEQESQEEGNSAADTNNDGIVDHSEIRRFCRRWRESKVRIEDLILAIGLWKER